MIVGRVNSDLEAQIGLTVRGPSGREARIIAVIDTGFSGYLTLPSAEIRTLGLNYDRDALVVLADGSSMICDIYLGTIVWDHRHLSIPIDEAETTPLVGTALLQEYELTVPFRSGQKIVLRKLKKP